MLTPVFDPLTEAETDPLTEVDVELSADVLNCVLVESEPLVDLLAEILLSTCLTEEESLTLALSEALFTLLALVFALIEALVEAETELLPEPASFILSLLDSI
ncbi:hypothetical protein M3M38_02295 [Fructilactobacillus cliffordii]|uniref:hypothetical protein n=1 Tax=Fructilactobacillus cliffordii TaxID=2940299 RepID=UPI002093B4FE|nr:hypothetical protein [Fructilactobacillus cliffordii]USS86915.1 hypothetical protein M3M38_02295 [Fructilactobacillus cliffordii]